MFSGEFEHRLDEKGRFIIPSKYRDVLVDGLYITRGLDGCLFVYTLDQWHEIAEKLRGLSLTSADARKFKRQMFSGTETKPDRQGRVLLPPYLRKHAAVEPGDEIIIVGVDSWLEIWNRQRWNEMTEKLETEGDKYAENLSDLGIGI